MTEFDPTVILTTEELKLLPREQFEAYSKAHFAPWIEHQDVEDIGNDVK